MACLASFRALFTNQVQSGRRPSYRADQDVDYSERCDSSTPRKGRNRHTLYPIDMSMTETETRPDPESNDEHDDQSAESEDQLCELHSPQSERVHLRDELSMQNECVAQQKSWLIVD